MDAQQQPLLVMPPVYQLPGLDWRWCRLKDVCRVAHEVATHVRSGLRVSPEQLVRAFAALTRHSKTLPEITGQPHAARPKKKIFRFSRDGIGFWGTEVPIGLDDHCPPNLDFRLDAPYPYHKNLFVTEDWVQGVIHEIYRGAHAVGEHTDGTLVGYRHDHARGDMYTFQRSA